LLAQWYDLGMLQFDHFKSMSFSMFWSTKWRQKKICNDLPMMANTTWWKTSYGGTVPETAVIVMLPWDRATAMYLFISPVTSSDATHCTMRLLWGGCSFQWQVCPSNVHYGQPNPIWKANHGQTVYGRATRQLTSFES
jgi:hypothetical protein